MHVYLAATKQLSSFISFIPPKTVVCGCLVEQTLNWVHYKLVYCLVFLCVTKNVCRIFAFKVREFVATRSVVNQCSSLHIGANFPVFLS